MFIDMLTFQCFHLTRSHQIREKEKGGALIVLITCSGLANELGLVAQLGLVIEDTRGPGATPPGCVERAQSLELSFPSSVASCSPVFSLKKGQYNQ